MNQMAGGMSSGMQQNSMQNMGGLPSLMQTPGKMAQSSYQPSYSTPQSMMQPQTPVSIYFYFLFIFSGEVIFVF